MSERMLRQNLWIRYVNVAFALFWVSGIALPVDPRGPFWCSLAAVAGNAVIHLMAVRSRDYREAAYRLALLDLATVLSAIYFTGAVKSPFVCVLPLTITSVYFVNRSLPKALAFGAAAFAGLVVVTALWWADPVPAGPWLPGHDLGWTVFVLMLQLLVIGGAAYSSQELPDPLVHALERQEARLAEQRQRAELGTSLAEIAHEIRNPLTTISITLEMASAASRDLPAAERARLARHLGTAGEELGRITRMLEGILSYARARRDVSRPASLDAGDALRRAAEFARLKWGRQRRRFAVTVEDGGAAVWADADAIHQVLVNLLDNAVQHPRAGRPLAIRLSAVSQGAWSVLTVEDNGAGIPADRREQLFHRFESGRAEGTGLGLAIARQFATDQGGSIDLAATSDAGTTFVLRLPAGSRPVPVDAPEAEARATQVAGQAAR